MFPNFIYDWTSINRKNSIMRRFRDWPQFTDWKALAMLFFGFSRVAKDFMQVKILHFTLVDAAFYGASDDIPCCRAILRNKKVVCRGHCILHNSRIKICVRADAVRNEWRHKSRTIVGVFHNYLRGRQSPRIVGRGGHPSRQRKEMRGGEIQGEIHETLFNLILNIPE